MSEDVPVASKHSEAALLEIEDRFHEGSDWNQDVMSQFRRPALLNLTAYSCSSNLEFWGWQNNDEIKLWESKLFSQVIPKTCGGHACETGCKVVED